MRIVSVKDRKVAKKLTERLIKKGLVVAQAEKEEDLKKEISKKADVIIVLSDSVTKTLD